jgi:flagellar basal body P-ring protein FlgI
MLVDVKDKETWQQALEKINNLSVNDEPIKVSLVNEYELMILIAGGVKLSDVEFAIQQWINSPPAHKGVKPNDFGYIRTVAIRRRAEVLIAKDEA